MICDVKKLPMHMLYGDLVQVGASYLMRDVRQADPNLTRADPHA